MTDHRTLLRGALEAVEQMEARLAEAERARREPIAIVGMGCRYPGANGPDAYWRLLRDAVDAVTEAPAGRWPADASPMDSPCYGGFLEDVDRFDPRHFGISPREATTMDPQQRLVLEVAWEAIENAGRAPDSLAGSATGVFLGITTSDYADLVRAAGTANLDVYSATGNAHNAAAGRLAYTLGLRGPCMAIDTACSSSLVAVHLACQSLRSGESDLALAGGVNVILTPEPFLIFSRWGMMAPDGRCKTFDMHADGFVRSEGCGVVVLKRLSDAIAQGDDILALVRGSAVNQDGASSGLTVPNGLAQQDVIRDALRAADIAPAAIGYVEAHGTGTALGDPIELEALDAVLTVGRSADRPLIVGSVKTNMGHLESASGIAGLQKAVLALRHAVIPPNLHFSSLTQGVTLALPPIVPTQATPWPASPARLAGVSSFGFSGTNAHVVLEAARDREPCSPVVDDDRPVHLMALSARSDEGLRAGAGRIADSLDDRAPDELPDICFTLAAGRTAQANRWALPVRSMKEARTALQQLRDAGPASRIGSVAEREPRIALLFTGQGSQYAGMSRDVYLRHPTFRQAIEQCADALAGELDVPLTEVLFGKRSDALVHETRYTQPALFAVEFALWRLWREWGVRPAAVIGHSIGEYVAACIAGVMDVEDAIRLVATRGRLMQALPPGGGMLAVFAGDDAVAHEVDRSNGKVELAGDNAPDNIVLSGDLTVLAGIAETLRTRAIRTQPLTVSHAFHSALMDPMLDAFANAAAAVRMRAPTIPLVSNVTGDLADDAVRGADYWRDHVRRPVRFRRGMESLGAHDIDIFLEIGPTPQLLGLARSCLGGDERDWLPSLRSGRDDWSQLLDSAAALWTRGVSLDFEAFDRPFARRRVTLPATTVFARDRFWVDTGQRSTNHTGRRGGHPLLGEPVELATAPGTRVWQNVISLSALPYLADHVVQGVAIVPATAYLEMMLTAGRRALGAGPIELSAIELEKPLFLRDASVRRVQLTFESPGDGITGLARIHSRDDADDSAGWTLHATGTVRRTDALPATEAGIDAAIARCGVPVSGDDFYALLALRGNEWGPAFRGIRAVHCGEAEAVSVIDAPDAIRAQLDDYTIHPALADAAGHVLAATIPLEATDGAFGGAFIGRGIERIIMHRRPRGSSFSAVARRRGEPEGNILTGDITLYDKGGVVAELVGARLWYTAGSDVAAAIPDADSWYHSVEWRDALAAHDPADAASDPVDRWLIFADQSGTGADLAGLLAATGQPATLIYAATECDIPARTATSDNGRGRGTGSQREPAATTVTIAPASEQDHAAVVESAFRQGGRVGIVHLWSLDAPADDALAHGGFGDAVAHGCGSVALLVRALSRQTASAAAMLRLVTRGAQPAGEEGSVESVSQAPLWGFGRALGAEYPELRTRLIDLDPAELPAEGARLLLREIGHDDVEDQIALRANRRLAPRIVRASPPRATTADTVLRPDGSYLVTGGLGGLGLLAARRLAERGARRLVLLGRSAPPERATWADLAEDDPWATRVAAIRRMEELGATVETVAIDIADVGALVTLLDRFRREARPPIRGVIHAAGAVLHRPAADLTALDIEETGRAKVTGAWLLHALLADAPLDFFVLFSSASALLPSPMVSAYAAANAALDALAYHRRARGLTALSIDWGMWAGVGMTDRIRQDEVAALAGRGMGTIDEGAGLDALERLLVSDRTHIAVLPVDWQRWREIYPLFTASPFFAEVTTGDAAPASATTVAAIPIRRVLADSPPEEREERLRELLRTRIAGVLHLSEDEIEQGRPITAFGLDSLMALELRSRIEADTGIPVPVVQLLEGPTLEGLAHALGQALGETTRPGELVQDGPVHTAGPIDPVGDHPLAYGQQALWFLHHLAPGRERYNIVFAARVAGDIDVGALGRALETLVRRHAMLRTTFASRDSGPVQVIRETASVKVERVACASADPAMFRHQVLRAARQPFDLEQGPLLRATLVSREPDEHALALTMHHIVFDAWSLQVLLGELQALLDGETRGTTVELPPLPAGYIDFVRWQAARLGGQIGERDRRFWRRKLAGELPVLRLAEPLGGNGAPTFHGITHSFTVDADVTQGLRAIAVDAGATLYMVVLAAYYVLLRQASGQPEVVIGSPVAGRGRPEFKGIVGYFVNMVALRLGPDHAEDFDAIVQHVREEALAAFTHQDYPFPLIVQQIAAERAPFRTPIFQAVFNFVRSEQTDELSRFYMDDGAGAGVPFGTTVLLPFPVPQQDGQFELALEMTESNGRLLGRFKCDTGLFAPGAASNLASRFVQLLRDIVSGRPLRLPTARRPAPPALKPRYPDRHREEIEL